MAETVAVLGGGVAGLTAAHELAREHFDVEVYDLLPEEDVGGKARSMDYRGTGSDGRRPWQGEHGYRFLPGFYKHVPETMADIELPDGGTVRNNLVQGDEVLIATEAMKDVPGRAAWPKDIDDWDTLGAGLRQYFENFRIGTKHLGFFGTRLLDLLSACDDRRFSEHERRDWWDFVDAEKRPAEYQKYVAQGMTQSLVAADARRMSARTAGLILSQLLMDMAPGREGADRVLNGPTSDVWLRPWLRFLREKLGVVYHPLHEVKEFHVDGSRIAGVTVKNGETVKRVEADWYVAALPLDVMKGFAPQLQAVDRQLSRLHLVDDDWMNGVVFYLAEDVPIVRGHTIYIDSAWSLTSISQAQFWQSEFAPENFGNGRARGSLSVCISDWHRARDGEGGFRADEATSAEQIQDEVWLQIRRHFTELDDVHLDDANRVASFLDPSISFGANGVENKAPLFLNTKGSWGNRPKAVTEFENLFLAGDYVQTYTDLATMESANEAARRAAKWLLKRSRGVEKELVHRMYEPWWLKPLRWRDWLRWRVFHDGMDPNDPGAPPADMLGKDGLLPLDGDGVFDPDAPRAKGPPAQERLVEMTDDGRLVAASPEGADVLEEIRRGPPPE